MRSTISAQSCASVPPAPGWISTKQSLPSASPLINARSSAAAAACFVFVSASAAASKSSASSSISASSASSTFSDNSVSIFAIASKLDSSLERSCMSFWASCGLSHRLGSSAKLLSSARRRSATSQSKTPPQQRHRLLDFSFHLKNISSHYGADMALINAVV